MKMPTLKTSHELEQVSEQLKQRLPSNKIYQILIWRFEIFNFFALSQLMDFGWLPQTKAGHRMDSSGGRTARQWTMRRGGKDNQIMQKKAKRRASICKLNTAICST
jgi:hypothetical protein